MNILLWDLETSFNTVATFRLKNDDYIPHGNILTERHIISAAYKWLGETKVHAVSVLDNKNGDLHDDRGVVKALHKVLSKADVIIAHNGDRYDTKFFAGRALAHGLKPLPPIVSIDTLKVSRKHFELNSHRLDYLARYLKVGKKMDTRSGLWMDALKGDRKAIKQMLAYNKEDVRVLESVFEKLRPYIKTPITNRGNCTNCGSARLHRNGTRRTVAGVYPRFYCKDCGKWYQGKTPVQKGSYERAI